MADESMTSDSSIDSVDESGKAFKKYLSQRRKDPNDAKDTASAAVEETLVNANEKGKNEKGKKKTKKAPAKKRKVDEENPDKNDWNDDETISFIELLEDTPCLWDVFHADYQKLTYSNFANIYDTNEKSIKAKINGLRAQLGREKGKETKTKSGQGASELYKSSWIHYDRLAFLLPAIGSSKGKDTLQKKVTLDSDIEEDSSPVPKKKSIAERKLDLLVQCTEAMTTSKNEKKPEEEQTTLKASHFSLYVEEKLSGLEKRKRIIAEKRISDILFEEEISDFELPAVYPNVIPVQQNSNLQPLQDLPTPQFNSTPPQPTGPHLRMLQS